MAAPSLSEVVEGRLISADSEIVASSDEPVRAVDVLGSVAAVYRVSIGVDGDWYEQCTVAVRSRDGEWRETGSGGARVEGWESPWRPSSETLEGRSLAVFGSTGSVLPDSRGSKGFVRCTYGFVDPLVRSLRVSTAGSERTVEVTSPVGAFVVVVRGEEPVELTALGESGTPIGGSVTQTAGPTAITRRLQQRNRRFGLRWGRP